MSHLGEGLAAAFADCCFNIADLAAIGIWADFEVYGATALRTEARAGSVLMLTELTNDYWHWVWVSNLIKPCKLIRISDRGGDGGLDPAQGHPQALLKGLKWEAISQVRRARAKRRRTSPDHGSPRLLHRRQWPAIRQRTHRQAPCRKEC